MRIWAVALVALSGCDILFELRDVENVDAAAEPGCGAPDEDGDCVADDIDNCPGIYNPSQANDGDGDSVGDVCDPRPTTSGDTRSGLWTFSMPATDATEWKQVTSTWTFEAGDVLHQSVTQSYAFLERLATNTEPDLTVEAGFTFGAWQEGITTGGHVGVWLATPDPTYDGETCAFGVYASAIDKDSVLVQERFAGSGASRRVELPALQPGDDLVVSLRRHYNPEFLQCRVRVNGVAIEVMQVDGVLPWPAEGHLAIAGGDANVTLRYVVSYVSN